MPTLLYSRRRSLSLLLALILLTGLGWLLGGTMLAAGDPAQPVPHRSAPATATLDQLTQGTPTPTPTATATLSTGTPPPTPTVLPSSTPQPTPTCQNGWTIVASPNPGAGDNVLHAVAAGAANDIWAVGAAGTANRVDQTLTVHWNGSAWSVVPSPNLGSGRNVLMGVVVVAPNDVWAVGLSAGRSQPLILHWDGTLWSIAATPMLPTDTIILLGVSAVAANDVWAVGFYYDLDFHADRTLTLHWNGTQWSLIASPNNSSTSNDLLGVAAVAANDVWAVGDYLPGSNRQTLILHWDGTTWTIVSSPNPTPFPTYLTGVAAISPSDIWAVGYAFMNGENQTLTEHWNGTAWTVVPSPNIGSMGDNVLASVAARTSSDVWAVGYGPGVGTPLVLHWNGASWTATNAPAPGAQGNSFEGVVALAANDVWAVGSYYSDLNPFHTLIEHYAGACGSPTPCPIQFSDVPADSPFYAYIRCLACRGIVSGYATAPPCAAVPCFLPGASVTRGQTAKFVANAANYQDAIPSTQQTFTDVPYGSPFWLYVERAALHGVISGYSTSPPCSTGVPCFLPGNNVTRGQTAKFVSQAANYQDPIPTTQQTFTDVPASDPFWLYVERSYAHGVVSGYSTSPPCASAPCFLPGNAVTRGQTSKFIANTFFPACQTPVR